MGSQTVPLGSVAPPANTTFTRPASGNLFNIANPQVASMAAQTLTPTGGSQPHNNMMPSLVLNYCIAMQGIFPQRP
jgi:microcystin-dependent protein